MQPTCTRFLKQYMIQILGLILLVFRFLRHTSMIQIALLGMMLMLMALPSNPVAAVPNLYGITADTYGILHMGNQRCPNWFCTRGLDITLPSAHACSSDITMLLHLHSLLLSPFRRIAQMIQRWYPMPRIQMTRILALFRAIWWKTTPRNGTSPLPNLPQYLQSR